MQIVIAQPPLIDKIRAVFPVDKFEGVIYSWGDRIYNPSGVHISKELMSHEKIHGERQGVEEFGILAWWSRYLADPDFRLREELPAHKAEYLEFCKTHSDRNKRAVFLRYTAERLSSPLYGGLLSIKQATHEIMTYR